MLCYSIYMFQNFIIYFIGSVVIFGFFSIIIYWQFFESEDQKKNRIYWRNLVYKAKVTKVVPTSRLEVLRSIPVGLLTTNEINEMRDLEIVFRETKIKI
jgi:hypothetical protein